MRMFYVIFELLQPSQILYKLDAKSTIYDRVASIFTAVLNSSAVVKNFNLKSIILQNMFKSLLAKAPSNTNTTSASLEILFAATKTEWVSLEERTR